jgi:hypothetical protein
MGKICRAYDYSIAEESRKPGYLLKKFNKVRAKLREQAEAERVASDLVTVEQAVKVHILKGMK